MASETETLNLDTLDTVASIRERLSTIRGKRVLLVLPANSALLQRKLDLVLVQREAYRRAIQLAIVSRNPQVVAHARELNISCFATVAASMIGRWRRGRQKVFMPRYHKPSHDPQPDELRSIASRLADRNRRQSRWRRYSERMVVLVLLFGVVGAAIYIVLPGAHVVVTLRQQQLSATLEVVADARIESVDLEKGIIPAQFVEVIVETTATVPTSGDRRLDNARATGIVTFTNKTDAPVTVPAQTILSTSAGEPVLFRTLAEVLVPAGIEFSVDVPFEAMQRYGGNAGNVAAGMVNTVVGPLADIVSLINLSAAVGGEARSVRVVAVGDKEILLNSARGQLQAIAYESMQSYLSDSQVIIIDSLTIKDERKDWTQFSADVGTLANELTLDMRATVSAFVIDERFGRQVAFARLRDQITANQTLLTDSLHYNHGPINWREPRKQASFIAGLTAIVVPEFDISGLREQLAGLPIDDARRLLHSATALAEVPAMIRVFPQGLGRMPSLPVRIKLEVEANA